MPSNALEKSRLLAQRTRLFALGAIRLRRAVTNSEEGRIIGRQLLRSATSVGANYRAAMRSRSKKEFAARIGVCVEEADESGYWLDLLADAEVVSPASIAGLRDEARQLTAMLSASHRTARNRLANGTGPSAAKPPRPSDPNQEEHSST